MLKELKKMLKRFKSDNRGDTLAVVIIGIFVVGMLGTIILAMTANNYKMRIVDRRSQTTFYQNEKVVDEIKGVIGTDALDSANDAYNWVLTNYISSTGSKRTDATAKFISLYTLGSTNGEMVYTNITHKTSVAPTQKHALVGIRTKFPEGNSDTNIEKIVQSIYDDFKGRSDIYAVSASGDKIENGSPAVVDHLSTDSGYAFNINTSGDTDVEYVKDASGNLEKISIKNINVSCRSNNGNYFTSITSDYDVIVPDITIDFSNSAEPDSLSSFYEYATIVEGTRNANTITGVADSTLTINGTTDINGNIFAGSSDKGRRTAIEVGNGATLNSISNVLYADGPIEFANNSSFNANSGATEADIDNYKLWAKDLLVSGNTVSIDINNSNVLLSDDLQINGDNATVNITGNYIGYGFADNGDRRNDEEGLSGSKTGLETTYNESTDNATDAEIQDHEQRSAIVVNGSNAKVDLSGLSNLFVCGRSFIDLQDGGFYNHATYMTGESISVKGSQRVYLSPIDNPNLGPYVGANFVSYTQAVSDAGSMSLENYFVSVLNTDSTKPYVKARRYRRSGSTSEDSDVIYFYIDPTDPREMTILYTNRFYQGESVPGTSDTTYTALINNGLSERFGSDGYLKIPSDKDKIFTIGTYLNYDNGVSSLASGYPGIAYTGDMLINQYDGYNAAYHNYNSSDSSISDISKMVRVVSGAVAKQNMIIPGLRDDANSTVVGYTKTNNSSIEHESDGQVFNNFVSSDGLNNLLIKNKPKSNYDFDGECKAMSDILKSSDADCIELFKTSSDTSDDAAIERIDNYIEDFNDNIKNSDIELDKTGFLVGKLSTSNSTSVTVDISDIVKEFKNNFKFNCGVIILDVDSDVITVDITNSAKKFTGLIVINGNVVLNNMTLNANADVVKFVLKAARIKIGSVTQSLGAWLINSFKDPDLDGQTDPLTGDELTYSDLIKVNNWRRTD